jgi:hypothetical protein
LRGLESSEKDDCETKIFRLSSMLREHARYRDQDAERSVTITQGFYYLLEDAAPMNAASV